MDFENGTQEIITFRTRAPLRKEKDICGVKLFHDGFDFHRCRVKGEVTCFLESDWGSKKYKRKEGKYLAPASTCELPDAPIWLYMFWRTGSAWTRAGSFDRIYLC